jgi:hypothetical protein
MNKRLDTAHLPYLEPSSSPAILILDSGIILAEHESEAAYLARMVHEFTPRLEFME